jgi:predicted ATPase/class 3 adenylate cyclase/Tfp pilus assembly protein PilF
MKIPNGTVTFLFTDIEGSTKFAQEFPETHDAVLQKHHSILREAFEANNGFVFEIVGDAFCCAFENAEDAVKAAVDAQLNLTNEKWNDAVIKVRIGIHTGSAEWNVNRYMGYITLARTARIMTSAYGEQIIISNNTYELISEKLNVPEIEFGNERSGIFKDWNISFRDLGERRLKDVIQPIRLFQILSPGLREDFPPLKTLDARPNNLPIQLTSFIGREEVMKDLKKLFTQTRLLTIIGSGGAGKTRLAMQIAAEMIDDFSGGVFFTELGPVNDPSLVSQTIMKSLEVNEEPGLSLNEMLTDYLKKKEMLLILDNCEHLINECAFLAKDLLSKCPGLKIIATSREALNFSGEQTYRLPSLTLPDITVNNTPEQLTQFEAVRLFIERALAVNPSFRVNNENAPALAQICHQLDGIPLAIELAAVRIKVLTVEKIFEKLDDRFRLLTGGKRNALPRQQTLKALIDWSYDLLSEKEKILWSRLSVFSGGWTLEAAEEICSDNNNIIIEMSEVIDLLSSLTEKSIVIFNDKKNRFTMLETIRQYGIEKIRESNEYEKFSDKHLKFYLELAQTGNTKLRRTEGESAMKAFDNEIGNIEKSLKFSIEGNRGEDGIKLVGAMGKFWQIRGYFSEGIHWSETVLHTKPETLNPVYGNVICQLGNFFRLKGDVDKARKFIDESLKIRRELCIKSGISDSLVRLGILEYDQAKYDESAKVYEESLAIYRETNDKFGIAVVLNNLGNVFSNQGKYSRAKEMYEESLATRRELGDKLGMAICLNNLGIITYDQGEYTKAKDLLNESLQLRYQVGNKDGIAICLINLGNVCYNQGEYDNALKFYKESLAISREIGDTGCISDSLYGLGNVSLQQKNTEEALKFFTDSLEISREIKAKSQIASVLNGLGRIAFSKPEYEKAKIYYCESVGLFREAGNNKDMDLSLLSLAELQVKEGHYVPAAKLLGFLNRKCFEISKIKFAKAEEIIFDELISGIKEVLTQRDFSKHFEAGKKLSLEEACRVAVSS